MDGPEDALDTLVGANGPPVELELPSDSHSDTGARPLAAVCGTDVDCEVLVVAAMPPDGREFLGRRVSGWVDGVGARVAAARVQVAPPAPSEGGGAHSPALVVDGQPWVVFHSTQPGSRVTGLHARSDPGGVQHVLVHVACCAQGATEDGFHVCAEQEGVAASVRAHLPTDAVLCSLLKGSAPGLRALPPTAHRLRRLPERVVTVEVADDREEEPPEEYPELGLDVQRGTEGACKILSRDSHQAVELVPEPQGAGVAVNLGVCAAVDGKRVRIYPRLDACRGARRETHESLAALVSTCAALRRHNPVGWSAPSPAGPRSGLLADGAPDPSSHADQQSQVRLGEIRGRAVRSVHVALFPSH